MGEKELAKKKKEQSWKRMPENTFSNSHVSVHDWTRNSNDLLQLREGLHKMPFGVRSKFSQEVPLEVTAFPQRT